jgi:hypothetical protein
MRRETLFPWWKTAAAASVITTLAVACGSSGTGSGPSATTDHSASSPAQPPQASTAVCQDNAALQASLANLADVSKGKGALKQAKTALKDAKPEFTALTGDAHGTFSIQINALKSALTTLQTAVKGVSSGSSSVAEVRTALGGVTKAATNLGAVLAQGGCLGSA